jgi:hypothetical protein
VKFIIAGSYQIRTSGDPTSLAARRRSVIRADAHFALHLRLAREAVALSDNSCAAN